MAYNFNHFGLFQISLISRQCFPTEISQYLILPSCVSFFFYFTRTKGEEIEILVVSNQILHINLELSSYGRCAEINTWKH